MGAFPEVVSFFHQPVIPGARVRCGSKDLCILPAAPLPLAAGCIGPFDKLGAGSSRDRKRLAQDDDAFGWAQ